MSRPILNEKLSAEKFKEYYWLKAELINFCRTVGMNSSGGKIDISNRIVKFIETGEVIKKSSEKKAKTKSNFDWKNGKLTTYSLITDNYKNTENVRKFFKKQIGSHFKFNTKFMSWMKDNKGKPLGEAVTEWNRIFELRKIKTYKTEIAPQFEYNTYIREFHSHNPNLPRKDAIKCWKTKKSMPGHNKYEDTDLGYLNR